MFQFDENTLTDKQRAAVIDCLRVFAARGRQLREEREHLAAQLWFLDAARAVELPMLQDDDERG